MLGLKRKRALNMVCFAGDEIGIYGRRFGKQQTDTSQYFVWHYSPLFSSLYITYSGRLLSLSLSVLSVEAGSLRACGFGTVHISSRQNTGSGACISLKITFFFVAPVVSSVEHLLKWQQHRAIHCTQSNRIQLILIRSNSWMLPEFVWFRSLFYHSLPSYQKIEVSLLLIYIILRFELRILE